MSMANSESTFEPVDCFKCRYFYITWDQSQPKGCKAFGFKTKKLPSLVVFESSGEKCLKFTPKDPEPTPSSGGRRKKDGWIA